MIAVLRGLVLIGLLYSLTAVAIAQDTSRAPLAVDTASPQATVRSFFAHRDALEELFRSSPALPQRELIATADHLVSQMSRLLDLSQIAPASRRKAGSEAIAHLVDILDRVTLPDFDTIPDVKAVPEVGKPASWTIPGTEIRLLRVMQGEKAGEFLFSSETVTRLNSLYGAMRALPRNRPGRSTDWTSVQVQSHGWLLPRSLVSELPSPLKVVVWNNPIWKLIAAALVILAVILVSLVGHRASKRFLLTQGVALYVRRLIKPLLFGALVWLTRHILVEQVSLASAAAELVEQIGTVALYVTGAWIAWLASALVIEYVIATPAIPDESLDAHLLRLLGKLTGIVSVASILAFGAQQVGLPVLGLLAGFGVGGLAIALAAQNSIENLIAGLNLYVNRPIKVGDRCRFGTIEGEVEQIGLRSTRIRGLDRTVTSIPNSDVAKAQLINFTMRDQMLFRHVVDLRYATSLDQLREFTSSVSAFLTNHPSVRSDAQPPRVYVVELAPWSIKVEVFAYVDAKSLVDFLPIQEELLRAIVLIVDQLGAEFAFPSQTNYLVMSVKTERLSATSCDRPS